jgi:hypothetical protein
MQTTIKRNAIELINSLPDSSTWDDIMYEIYVKQKIDKGLDDIENGKLTSHENIRKMFIQK